MNGQLFTDSVQDLLNQAARIANRYNHELLKPIHTLGACLNNDFCLSFFNVFEIPVMQLQQLVEHELNSLPRAHRAQVAIDESLQEFLQACKQEAESLGDQYISLEHLFLQWVTTKHLPASIRSFFADHGLTKKEILKQMENIRRGRTADNHNAENRYETLEKYCQNITTQARAGKLDPVIGRHEEIRRVIQILSRRTKNNPVLIGEPGVGKTAIVEGIAQRIVNDDVPEGLRNKTIYSLDLGLLIAGAKYQGEFENRLKGLLKEIEEGQENIILFIDELHMLIGAGASGGGMDASNLLKPALARGTLHCIGATTLAEYKKYIEKDAALERRFQKVLIEEPSVEDTTSILRGLREKYELHHGIRIKDQALVDAAVLSNKYIPDRFLPDKAIDLIDEAASMIKMSIDSQPEEIDKLDRKIRQLEIEKLALKKESGSAIETRLTDLEKELAELKERHKTLYNQWQTQKAPLEKINKIKEEIDEAKVAYQAAERRDDYAKASEIKYGKLDALEKKLIQEQNKLKNIDTTLVKQEVDEHDIAMVLARWTKIPVEKLTSSETKKLLNMESLLKNRVIGQDEALQKVAHAIQVHRAGLADPNKPIGSFLFLGPTGVGKTEVARTLADFLFNDSQKMIRIDMSEYMEKHSVARLIGAPPGYVGHEEGGQLTEQVRRHPYSVVLFDEIEKAHSDVFNIFLQILDEGKLTDGQGRTVSFKNCIIIMTSNIGSELLLARGTIDETVKTEIDKLLHMRFKPELLNRIDAIVFFKALDLADVEKIASIQIKELEKKLAAKNIKATITDALINTVAERGYSKEFGARPLKREIHNFIYVPVSQFLLENPDIKVVKLDAANGVLEIFSEDVSVPKTAAKKSKTE
ncbi:MAG TPA: AAA family ATPase [Candidatus Babeliales bacterium]|nr:AAA family ATPase [Candidatus Babeliales bacterium]